MAGNLQITDACMGLATCHLHFPCQRLNRFLFGSEKYFGRGYKPRPAKKVI